jgi:hypothetical protein
MVTVKTMEGNRIKEFILKKKEPNPQEADGAS